MTRDSIFSKVYSGRDLSVEELTDVMRDVHNAYPNLSEKLFFRKSEIGATSYHLLAEECVQTETRKPPAILDLGCGVGTLVYAIEDKLPFGCDYFGIDLSLESLTIAKKRFTHSRYKFFESSALSLPFADNTFDFALSHMSFMLFRPAEKAVSEVARVLQHDGIFAAVVPVPWASPKDQNKTLTDEYRELLRELLPNFSKNNGGIGEPDFYTPQSIESLFINSGKFKKIEIMEFDVDFSGTIDEVLWNLQNLYWYYIIPEEKKLYATERLKECLRNNADKDQRVKYVRRLAVIKSIKKGKN